MPQVGEMISVFEVPYLVVRVGLTHTSQVY